MRHAAPKRRWAALLTVLVALGLTGLVAVPAGAAPSSEDLPVAVSLAAMAPQVLTPGEDLSVTVNLRNNGDEEITAPRASVRIYRYRMSTRDQLDQWATNTDSGPYGDVAATQSLDAPIPPGGSATVTITVPARSIGLSRTSDAWGPRGLTVDVGDGGSRVGIERSFLLWDSDDDLTPTQVAVLTPITGPAVTPTVDEDQSEQPAPQPSPTATPTPTPTTTTSADPEPEPSGDPTAHNDTAEVGLDALTASGGRLSRLLQATAGHPSVSWAVDPALLRQVAGGSRADRAWSESLTAAGDGREVLRLPWADPDLAALAHSGRSSSTDLLGQALTSSAAATDDLLTGADTVLWGSNPVLDEVTAELAAAHGDGAALVTGTASMPARSDSASAPTTVQTDGGQVTALVPDATLSELLTDPNAVQAGSSPAVAAQRMLAETAVIARGDDSGGSYVLVTTPRDWSPQSSAADAQLTALESAPWVRTTSVADMLAAQDAGAVTSSDRTDPPSTERDPAELTPAWVNALATQWESAEDFASVVADPAGLLRGLDTDVLAPLSVAWRADPDGRAGAVEAAIAQATARQSGLSVLLNEQFTVISSSSQITVNVRNELDQDATVRVELRPQKGCLETTRSPLVSVAANSETPVALTLRATANCDVDVDVSLIAENGRELSMPQTISLRLAPTIESVGTIVVGALLFAGLLFGIWRTVRRGQTTRRGARVLAEGSAQDTKDD